MICLELLFLRLFVIYYLPNSVNTFKSYFSAGINALIPGFSCLSGSLPNSFAQTIDQVKNFVVKEGSYRWPFQKLCFLLILERKWERERGEKHQSNAALCVPPQWGLSLQLGHVPWLGIELATSQGMERDSAN